MTGMPAMVNQVAALDVDIIMDEGTDSINAIFGRGAAVDINAVGNAFRIIDEAKVGLAPGSAFGPDGEGFFRLCFNRRLDQIEEAAQRLGNWLAG